MLWARNLLFLGFCAAGLAAVAGTLFSTESISPAEVWKVPSPKDQTFQDTVAKVNAEFRAAWHKSGVNPVDQADDLTVARRLALALAGTIPSLEEIRRLEALPEDDRQPTWVNALLEDRRTSDYLAERYARQFVGVEEGPFLLYRRRRFVAWLADELHQGRPLDQLCREVISAKGLWTDQPATNFVTVALVQGQDNKPDVNKLAGRVSRAMLGIRLDCAQCHDHPFNDRWQQTDFQHLAAFFGETTPRLTGIQDNGEGYFLDEPENEERKAVSAEVPFAPERLPDEGTLRSRLAHWITHPGNKYFARAQVNRIWGLMFGKPLVEPVDDLPLEGPYPPGLETLADEFIRSGYDWQRLIRIIASCEVFQLESGTPADRADFELTDEHEQHWAIFPLVRLRPEQVVGGLLQAASLKTIDYDSHILVRFARSTGERDFLRRYGDIGEDELSTTTGTIPQRLVLLNGNLVHEKINDNLVMNASTRIAALAPDDPTAVETAFLAVLTRRPTLPEARHFVNQLREVKNRGRSRVLTDIYWVLLNGTEFAWNH